MPDRRTGSNAMHISVRDRVKVADVIPFGINLGFHDRFGASQILKNLVVNPGFEVGEYATIVIVDRGGTPQRFTADNWQTRWNNEQLKIGQPTAFWEGATYEVVFGQSRGRWGRITRFRHEADRYAFYTDNHGAAFAVGDVIYLRHRVTASTAGMNFAQFDRGAFRPNSPGRQSLRLQQPPNPWQWSWVYTMDSVWRDSDPEAGKLLIADGEWELSFWARGNNRNSKLRCEFSREGERKFFDEEIALTGQWRQVTRRFTVPTGGDRYHDPLADVAARVLALKFRISAGGHGWIDDVVLQRAGQRNPTVFSDRFVDKLKELQPGVLRNWGLQLGSTLENQLARPFGRKPTGHSPRQRQASNFHFSLHEFLELAYYLGAEPWYVIPPSFTLEEMQNLVAYLAAPAGKHRYATLRHNLGQVRPWTEMFPQIHLEYGNEMWGANTGADPFLGATLRGGERLGTIAGERFEALKQSVYFRPNADKFNLIIGGQTFAVERQHEIEQFSDSHNTVAISPYFGHLDDPTESRMFQPLYARAFQDIWSRDHGLLRANQKALAEARKETKLAIYELNFHTTTGANVPLETRNKFVASIAGGIALPLHMLLYLRDAGVRNQCAFTALQFSFAMSGQGLSGQHVRLWGMLRDLEATGRARPTWLALQLVNRAMIGDMLYTAQRGAIPTWRQNPVNHIKEALTISYIHSFAFRENDAYNILLFNLHPTARQRVQVELADNPMQQGELYQLVANSAEATNEENNNVTIRREPINILTATQELILPPHSISLIETRTYRVFIPSAVRPPGH